MAAAGGGWQKSQTFWRKCFCSFFDFLNNILLACNLPLTTGEEVRVQKLGLKGGFGNVSYSPAQLVISIKYEASGVLCLWD